MNALLFSNELLHKIYKDEGKFDIFYNIPHIIRQIKVYLKNGTGIDKY